jgi:hypothetical protein
MKPITIFWAILTILFLTLGVFHIFAAYQTIQPFQIKAKGSVGAINGMPVHTGFKNFVSDFNLYIDNYNKSNRCQNLLTSFGYLLASLTALVSMFLTIDRYSNCLNKFFKIEL